jgi:hypothetical protein
MRYRMRYQIRESVVASPRRLVWLMWRNSHSLYSMTWFTTSRAVFCTSARCSGPLKDSA